MKKRMEMLQSVLEEEGVSVLTLTSFPRLGCSGSTFPTSCPDRMSPISQYVVYHVNNNSSNSNDDDDGGGNDSIPVCCKYFQF